MTIAEKLTRAKADMDGVYSAGYSTGLARGLEESGNEYPLSEFLKFRDGQYLFYSCTKLTTVPLFDTSNVTNMSDMFYGCDSLTTVPLFDTRNVTNMSYMFSTNRSSGIIPLLTTVPLFDTGNVTNMSYMFKGRTKLTTIPLFDTRNVTNMASMFQGCHDLTTVPLFDTRNVTNMSCMFQGDSNHEYFMKLVSIPELDVRNVTNMHAMFATCKSLTDCYLRNIKVNLQVGSGTSWGHLLTVDSLIHLIYELRDTGSTRTLTVGSANLEKLANVYVRVIDITDEMRAEDDLIDEKLPFEVCESTDEGAMLITDYVSAKNWSLQ